VVGLKRLPRGRTCVNRKVEEPVAQYSWALIPVSKQGKKKSHKCTNKTALKASRIFNEKYKSRSFQDGQTIKFAAKRKP
jgi:hypothetical protein